MFVKFLSVGPPFVVIVSYILLTYNMPGHPRRWHTAVRKLLNTAVAGALPRDYWKLVVVLRGLGLSPSVDVRWTGVDVR